MLNINFKKPQLLTLILLGVIAVMFLANFFSFNGENRRLKKDIKKGLEKIETLEKKNLELLDSVNNVKLLIIKKDITIDSLIKKKDSLNNNLKYLILKRNETINSYNNSTTGERIRVFSELATDTD